MVLGCGLGFLREYLDHTFKRPEDIVRFAELPVLFSLEKWKI
jgi:capsular polysaccharide biosynthesis protein